MFSPKRLSLFVALCLFTLPAASHEYWIEATKPIFGPGERLEANLKVGEDFKGQTQIFAPSQYENFVIVARNQMRNFRGVLGDAPAARMKNVPAGLAVLAMVSSYSKITYTDFEKFKSFARAHGEDHAIAEHAARGLPTDRVAEAYRRFAKALVPVEAPDGNDVRFGMELELTAETNPYAGGETVRYILTRNRVPVADHQVDIFFRAKPGMDATKTSLQSDAGGFVEVPLRPGQTMVSAVALEEPSAELAAEQEVVWYSLWATSTFWLP